MSMIATAWLFECQSQDCARRHSYRPVSLHVKGDKKQAMAQARAKGWRPCSEARRSTLRRSTATWWCPGCVGLWEERIAKQERDEAKLRAALDRTQAQVEVRR